MMTGQLLERGAGILLPVTSLPSPYGIGTFGKAAYEFVDFLRAAGQKYWQVLPLGPTSYGDSPYQSFSAYAGNPYFIDLEILVEEGLLEKEYLDQFSWGGDETSVSYETIYQNRFQVLRTASETARIRRHRTSVYLSGRMRTGLGITACIWHVRNILGM